MRLPEKLEFWDSLAPKYKRAIILRMAWHPNFHTKTSIFKNPFEMEALLTSGSVSYTHLTLPTICSV